MPKFKPYSSLTELYQAFKEPTVDATQNVEANESARLNNFEYSEYLYNQAHALIVKQFKEQSYNGPTKRDFQERLNIIFETAKMKLKEQFDNQQFNQTEYELKLKKIEAYKATARDAINNNCTIAPKYISDDLVAREKKEVIPVINQAKQYIQQFVFDALVVIEPDAFQSKKQLTRALSDFSADESRLTAEKGRRNFINLYPIPKGDLSRVSMQRVINDAIPSTERDGKLPGKLPNFVECGIGYKKADGSFFSEFSGYRHSSYPTIKVADDFVRQKNTALTVRDMLAELARKKLLTNPALSAGIIELNLSSLTLLSPVAIIEKFGLTDESVLPKGESEYKQLEESYNALMMYNDRVIDLEVDGGTFQVKLNVNLVNAAANPIGVYAAKQGISGRRLAQSTLEKHINTEGMNRYIEQTERYLKEKNHPLVFENLTPYQPELGVIRQQLIEKNKQLELDLMADNQSAYHTKKQEISNLKNQIYAFELKVMDTRKEQYFKHRSEIDAYLQSIKDSPNKSPEMQVAELYYQSIAMYMDGQVEPAQFGARYLLVRQKTGDDVEYFCKSGEDRTGRVQNLLEELCEFNRSQGRFPVYDFKNKQMDKQDREMQQNIAQYVSEFSVSRDINNENVHGARGLQIGSSLDLNKKLPNSSGDALAKTHKRVYLLGNFLPKKALTQTIKGAQGNVLVEEDRMQGFFSRVVRSQDRSAYEQSKSSSSPPRSELLEGTDTLPTYQSKKIDKHDLVVIEKTYTINNNSQTVVARLEREVGAIRDVTEVPQNGLPEHINQEAALQQAYAMLSPPFQVKKDKPLILKGNDNAQVARVHAALLALKSKHDSLKNLVILVKGNSPRPSIEQSKAKQKEANELFIKSHLSNDILSSARMNEFVLLVNKQNKFKSLVGLGRKDSNSKLNLIEDAKISPYNKQ